MIPFFNVRTNLNGIDLNEFAPGKQLSLEVIQADGSKDVIKLDQMHNLLQKENNRLSIIVNLINKKTPEDFQEFFMPCF